MKDDTSSLRALARSIRSDADSVIAHTISTFGETAFSIDGDLLESGPYKINGGKAAERHMANMMRQEGKTSSTRRRTEEYTSQSGNRRERRSTSPREKIAERLLQRQASESRDDRSRLYAQGRRARPPDGKLAVEAPTNTHARTLSDSFSSQESSRLVDSISRPRNRSLQTTNDDSSVAGSEMTSPTITIQDTESSRTTLSSSPSSSWTPPASSRTTLGSDLLQRSPSRYSWRAEPPLDRRSPPTPQLLIPNQHSEERISLWGAIRRHPSVARFSILNPSSKPPPPSSPVTPPSAYKRGHVRAENDVNRSVDFKQEELPALVEATQEGRDQQVEYLLDQGANLEEVTPMTRRTALAVAAHCGKDEIARILLGRGANLETSDFAGMTPLHLAADRGHNSMVNLLVSWDAMVNCGTPALKTPLRLAVDGHHHEVAQTLLQSGARVNSRDNRELTALHAAAKEGDLVMVNILVSHKADLEARDAESMAAIHYAAAGGHIAVVEKFFERKVPVDYPGEAEMTPLMIACATGKTDMVKFLIKKKANLKKTSDRGMTALHWACYHGQKDVVDLLVQRKISIELGTSDSLKPLHVAVQSKSWDTVEYLLRSKASKDSFCSRGWRPLHYACDVGDTKIVELLLNYKVDVEATNHDQQRAIHIATLRGCHEAVAKLLGRNATYDCLDKNGDRPLTLACMQGDLQMTRVLLNRGASLRLKFKPGQSYEDSPMCVAAQHGHHKIIVELIKREASVRQTDERGWQPLRYAAYHGHADIVETLLQYEASVLALNLGAFGISTSDRIGFANNVTENNKVQILEMLRTAEALERSKQEAAERVNFPVQHGYAEMESYSPGSRPNLASRNPFRTRAQPASNSANPTPTVPSWPAPSVFDTDDPPVRNSVAHIAAMSSRISSAPSIVNHEPLLPGFSTGTPLPSHNSLPRRAQTTRPRSTVSGLFSDEASSVSPMPSVNISRSITVASSRTPAPTRTPPLPPTITPAAPTYFAYHPSMSQASERPAASDGLTPAERQQLLELTCGDCKSAQKLAPDLTCTTCRSNVFQFSHHAQQASSGPASNTSDGTPRMSHLSGPVYEMPVRDVNDE